ncbi:MAG: hypothetical protein PHE79_03335 [Eubacteriales bacterium]|nr:hypothetical protein [Eubacteriales bacterium]
MARKEITARTFIVTFENGKRIERNLDDIPEDERKNVARKFTDEFMVAAGYRRADQDQLRA